MRRRIRPQRPSRTPAQHVGHHAHRVLVWLGGVLAVLILIAGAGIWRLMQGPVELDRLIPYVQQAFARSGSGLDIAVSRVSIAIDRQTHQLDLRINDVSLKLPNGEKLASFPEMATSFSLGGLLGGRIEPTRLTIERPVLMLTRDENGALSFRVGDSNDAARDVGLDNPLAIFAPPREGAPWSQLRQVTIRDATIIVDDRQTGRTWRANRVAATLERSEAGVTGDLSLAAQLGTNTPELHATYRYGAAAQSLDLELAVDGLDPTALAPFAPILAPLAQAQMPVSGSATIRFDLAAGRVEGGRLDLGFGAGRIETPMYPNGLSVVQGELHADYASEKSQLRLQQLALDLGDGTRLVIDGQLDGLAPTLVSADSALPGKLGGTLGVTLTHVPASRFAELWPLGVAKGGKKWATANLSDGVLDEVAMQLVVAVDPVSLAAAFSGAHGTMRFRDMTLDYFNGLPPARKVSGSATLADRRLDFTFTGGQLKALKATGGTVTITDLGAPVETMVVDIGIAGPLQDALDVIDTKPLHYAHEAGFDPARIGGKADAQLHFKMPLVNDLKFDMVDYGVKATLTGASFARAALDRDLTDGNFALELGHAGTHVQGNAKFDGTPATVDFNLYFHPANGPRSRFRIGLTLDDAMRQRLGWISGVGRLTGPIAADLTYAVPQSGTHARLDATFDLTGARLIIREAGWEKPPQVPGSAKLAVDLDGDAVTGVPQVEVKAPGLDSSIAVTLSPNRDYVQRVDIRHLVVADSDIAGVVSRRPDGSWHADIHGARLDLSHEFKHALDDDSKDAPPPLQIDAHLARLMLGPHREMREVSAALSRDRGVWQSIRIAGNYPKGGRLAITLGGADGARRLHIESDDLGASLSLFGIADNVVGGRVAIDGTVSEADGHQMLRAHINGSDYSLVQAPALARLLSLASFEGVYGMMSGSGIPFTTLRGDFTFERGRITLEPMIAYGGALGVTAHGWLSPHEDRIDVDGTVAPVYVLNSLIGNFPIIGSLLTGGEGQGMFAAAFRLTGSNDDPGVSVNPLSALTPGLLRHLFDPFFGSSQAPPTQQAAH